MPKRKIALVTGATGFVGSNIARRLVSEGYQIHIIRRKGSNKWRLEGILQKLNDHTADFLDRKKLTEMVKEINPEIIFHLAAQGVYGGMHEDNIKYVEGNLVSTMNLIDACEKIDYSCFVNTGSSSEYGFKEKPMRETDVCEPIDIYGITKCTATMYAQMAVRQTGKPIITFRLFSPYGPFDNKRRLISYAITKALKGETLLLANPDVVRDYIFVEDVVDLYIKSIGKAYKFAGEIFNAGSGKQSKISDVVGRILEISKNNSTVKWNSVSGRQNGVKKWEADISKTSKCFAWKPKHSIEAGLKKTIKWFSGNLNAYE